MSGPDSEPSDDGAASSTVTELPALAGEVAEAFARSFRRDFVRVAQAELPRAENPAGLAFTIAEPTATSR